MRRKKHSGIGVNLVFILMSITFLIPFVIIISVSISNEADIARYGFAIIPKTIDFTAFKFIFEDIGSFGKSMLLTLVTAVGAAILACAVQAMLAYPLARGDYRFAKHINRLLVFLMVFGAGTVPTYIFITRIYGLKNNILLFLIMGMVTPWGVILYRTFFKGIPREIYESADVDGATNMQMMWYIVLPMAKAIFGIQFFTGFIGHWNSFETSLLYMTDPNKFLIQHYMSRILESAEMLKQAYAMAGLENKVDVPIMTMRYAMCLISIIPVFILFPKMQKHFSKGIAVGSVKG